MGLLDSTFGGRTDFPDDATIIEITDGEAELVTTRRSRARRIFRRGAVLLGVAAAGAGIYAYWSRRRAGRNVADIEVTAEAETDEMTSE